MSHTYTTNTTNTGYSVPIPNVIYSNTTSVSNLTWTSPSYTIGTVNSILDGTNNSLHVRGDANFEGDVKIKGKSIVDLLERIEEKLAILKPNEELEAKWEKLRNLRKEYMELEAEIIEKEGIWATLKK